MNGSRQPISCVWCSSERASSLSGAVVAPWVIGVNDLNSASLDTALYECAKCGLQFFWRRYSSSELRFIYSDYRGDKYLKRRRRWEPWYSSKRNHLIGHDQRIETIRKQSVESFLSKFLNESSVLRIVDYGGDEGQFIPELLNVQFAGVFEVSGRPVRSGVSVLRSLEEVRSSAPNLIMLCHVLEHLTEPRIEFETILTTLSPGGHVYIEVPLDSHRVKSPTPNCLISFYRLNRMFFVISDLVSQICRFKFGWQSRFRLIKQSEHLQFFVLSTLNVIAQELRLNYVGSFTYLSDKSVGTPQTLGVLFQKQ